MNFDTFRKKRFPHMKDHGPLYEVARICYEAGIDRVERAMDYMGMTQGGFDQYTDKEGGYNYQTGRHCQSRGQTRLEAVESHASNSDYQGNLL